MSDEQTGLIINLPPYTHVKSKKMKSCLVDSEASFCSNITLVDFGGE
jgi:hypothetical protein